MVGVEKAGGERLAAERVVLSAGAYASPALLLRSGIGPTAEPRRLGIAIRGDLPGVGASQSDLQLFPAGPTQADGTTALTMLVAVSH